LTLYQLRQAVARKKRKKQRLSGGKSKLFGFLKKPLQKNTPENKDLFAGVFHVKQLWKTSARHFAWSTGQKTFSW